MKKQTVVGIIIGAALGTAATVAGILVVRKIVKEIKSDLNECIFMSPYGDNVVTVTHGSSKFAKGLTFVKIKAENEKDTCNLNFLTGKSADSISFNWEDDDHIEICIGENAVKQVCYVSFEGEEIQMTLCAKKDD